MVRVCKLALRNDRQLPVLSPGSTVIEWTGEICQLALSVISIVGVPEMKFLKNVTSNNGRCPSVFDRPIFLEAAA
jgi:hypothetical protein